MEFKRISGLINPFSDKLFDYPGIIFPCFDIEKDKAEFIQKTSEFSGDIILEYGSGSGNHLIQVASRHPEALCIGFEIRFKRAVRTIEKAQEKGITNILIFRNKGEFIPELFSKNRIKGIFINFPDPWNKKRWFKHRVLTKAVIDSFIPSLKSDGFVSIKTDHNSYYKDFIGEYENIKKENLPYIFASSSEDLHKDLTEEHNFWLKEYCADIKSEFEKLFESQNKNINYCLIKLKL